MKKNYTQEFKIIVVKDYQNLKSISIILDKHQISRSSLYEWLKIFNTAVDPKTQTEITYKDYLQIKKQLEKKTRELEIIEKTHCFKDSPRQQKLEAVERLFGQYSVKRCVASLTCHTAHFTIIILGGF